MAIARATPVIRLVMDNKANIGKRYTCKCGDSGLLGSITVTSLANRLYLNGI